MQDAPLCSFIIVTNESIQHGCSSLNSVRELDYPPNRLEIIIVHNSSVGAADKISKEFPGIRVIRNPVANLAYAVNLGAQNASGDYFALADSHVLVDRNWLAELVEMLEKHPAAGMATGMLLSPSEAPDSDDEGIVPQSKPIELDGIRFAAVLVRKECFRQVGGTDESFAWGFEYADLAKRCVENGWDILHTPKAHAIRLSKGSPEDKAIYDYFHQRGSMVFDAKHFPDRLPYTLQRCRFTREEDWDSLHDVLLVALKTLVDHHPSGVVGTTLAEVARGLESSWGKLATDHLLGRLQVILGHRKMSVAVYDHALHIIGGGQRYGCTLAAALQEDFDVTLISNKPVTKEKLEGWYGLDLAKCKLKVVRLGFFDLRGGWIDSNQVNEAIPNPFRAVSVATQSYDILVNANQLAMVEPDTPFSVFLCHFPDTPRRCYFAVNDYSCVIVSSSYGAEWIKKRWTVEPTFLLYPPVEMGSERIEKDNIILSVARFEPGGSKKQDKLIEAFRRLYKLRRFRDGRWRLILVGGSPPQNEYLDKIHRLARECSAPVEVMVNVPVSVLRSLYAKAKIFWHACGLGEAEPQLIEHFGMSTVEAMQNYCVPVVFDGGGQREIVEHKRSGFRFRSLRELCKHTEALIANPDLLHEMSEAAFQRGQLFNQERFVAAVRKLFEALESEYANTPVADPDSLRRGERPTCLFLSRKVRNGRIVHRTR